MTNRAEARAWEAYPYEGGAKGMICSASREIFIKGYQQAVDDLTEQMVQYDSIESAIKAHASTYSFNIESELFPQLTKEQQSLWKKEIEQAVVSGGQCGWELANDVRYKENNREAMNYE